MKRKEHRKTLKELEAGLVAETDTIHTIRLIRPLVTIFEAEDANFHLGSSVFMPMGMNLARHEESLTVSAIETVVQALEYSESISERMCLAGHTDTLGPERTNEALAAERALHVTAFIQGDRAAWVRTCAKHRNEDVQHLLTWAAYAHGHACDPGPIDGIIGPRTKAALAQFRRAHNVLHGTSLLEGEQLFEDDDWDAMFTLYDASAIRLLGGNAERWGALRRAVRWHEPKVLACGESWPIEARGLDNHRSQTNRRVELLFFHDSDFIGWETADPPGKTFYGSRCDRRYVLIQPRKVSLQLKILDPGRAPLKHRNYRIRVAGEQVKGESGENGEITVDVPATALSGELFVDAGSLEHPLELRWSLMLGPMPPLSIDAGAQGRMGHLGVPAGSPREGSTQPDPAVVSAYQRTRRDLSDSGELDDDTRRVLDEEYGLLSS